MSEEVLSKLQQKAYENFTVEHYETEGVPFGVIGKRFTRFVFDGRYGNDLRESDKPKSYSQLSENIQQLEDQLNEARNLFKNTSMFNASEHVREWDEKAKTLLGELKWPG